MEEVNELCFSFLHRPLYIGPGKVYAGTGSLERNQPPLCRAVVAICILISGPISDPDIGIDQCGCSFFLFILSNRHPSCLQVSTGRALSPLFVIANMEASTWPATSLLLTPPTHGSYIFPDISLTHDPHFSILPVTAS